MSKIKNIAIIAHVDHGKTTLVDHILRQTGTFRANEHVDERVMDSMDLERERGITIAAKNASFFYQDYKINIVDTPGHSDFGGEVERVLNMVDGAVLLVDSSEGPMPQTRFVLSKALEQGLKVVVCVNKIDRPDARISEVLDEVFDLFIDLAESDEEAEFDVVYAIGREGVATLDPQVPGVDLRPLLDKILEKIPDSRCDANKPLQLLVANIDYSDYVGRLAIGRVQNGRIAAGDDVLVLQKDGSKKMRVSALYAFQGLKQMQVTELVAGDIAVLAGYDNVEIGDTIASVTEPLALKRIEVEEPTVAMIFSVNDSPFAGKEGTHVTSRKILERLQRELLHNVSIRVELMPTTDSWKVMARGELQLAVLVETMRREGYELAVGKPIVLFKEIDGVKKEPIELAVIDVDSEFTGVVTEKLGQRRGILVNMVNKGTGRTRLEFEIPARGLIGYRSEFLTDTRGTGLLSSRLVGYQEYRGDIAKRTNGVLLSDRGGKTTAYALYNLEPRGRLFVRAGEEVYAGQVIGEHAKEVDLIVNCCRDKKLTNVRASGADEAIRLTPVRPMSLEFALEWISDDELVEITPRNVRIRSRELDLNKRRSKKEKES